MKVIMTLRWCVISAVLGVIFCSAAVSAASPGKFQLNRGDIRKSDIVVDIEVRQVSDAAGTHVLVTFTFTNRGPARERLERWLALDPADLTLPVLRVTTADGSAIRYVGRHVYRRAPTKGDFLSLAPA